MFSFSIHETYTIEWLKIPEHVGKVLLKMVKYIEFLLGQILEYEVFVIYLWSLPRGGPKCVCFFFKFWVTLYFVFRQLKREKPNWPFCIWYGSFVVSFISFLFKWDIANTWDECALQHNATRQQYQILV